MLQFDFRDMYPASLMAILDDQGLTNAILDQLAQVARAKWINVARRELSKSRQTYVEGIQQVVIEGNARVITLTGWLPVAIEEGIAGWDLRETILWNTNSKARHPIKGGRSGSVIGYYANIPFRHGTPGTSGLAQSPMGSLYGPRAAESLRQGHGLLSAERAGDFGKEIYKIAKKLRAENKTESLRPEKMREKSVERLFEAAGGRGLPLLKPHHKTSIYAGMTRERKPYKKESGKTTVHTYYQTFRRISTMNDEGWHHPGIKARNLANQVVDHLQKITPFTIKRAISEALKK